MAWAATRNAIGPDGADQVTDALRVAGERARGAVVLSGEKAFCSGGDRRDLAHAHP
ncbi:MAG: hypothetical protein ACRDRL_10480 [Sciscionella sp.]